MRTSSTIAVLAGLALAIPIAARAEQKLALGTIRGDASRVRRQILVQVCETHDCVAASKVVTGERPDPQKLQRAGVAGYLGGAVTGEPGERVLVLSLTTPSSTASKPARTWRLRLAPDGTLRPQTLQRFATELDQTLAGEVAQPSPSPSAPPQRPAPAPPPAAKPPPAQPPAAAEPAPAPQAEKAAARPEAPSGRPPLRVAGEAGLWITGRKLTWSGASSPTGTTPLRSYDASAILVPAFRLEVYPAAMAGAGKLAAGLGLFASYGHSVGLQVKPPSGATEGNHPGTLTSLDAGVLWRLQPVSGSRFAVAPAAAYRNLQVTTSSKDGVTIDGLPDTKTSGFELRVDTEIPVGSSVALLAGGGYTLWTSKKDVVSDAFFGKGSANAFQVEGGVSWRFHGPLSLKGVVDYESTSYSGLEDPAPGLGSASGAKDANFGGRLMLRAEY